VVGDVSNVDETRASVVAVAAVAVVVAAAFEGAVSAVVVNVAVLVGFVLADVVVAGALGELGKEVVEGARVGVVTPVVVGVVFAIVVVEVVAEETVVEVIVKLSNTSDPVGVEVPVVAVGTAVVVAVLNSSYVLKKSTISRMSFVQLAAVAPKT
jgi:hypothetical protein